ncbi:hypothetical protein QZH41_003355 [Actinostola sp. cb2023]|nr:hypothetical protein QZH41_003355 [Actinostola sp. cb2023]
MENIFHSPFSTFSCLQEDELKKAILVVFANKQDMEGALTSTEVSNALGLSALKSRTWAIFKTSAVKGDGLDEAMECSDWLKDLQITAYK